MFTWSAAAHWRLVSHGNERPKRARYRRLRCSSSLAHYVSELRAEQTEGGPLWLSLPLLLRRFGYPLKMSKRNSAHERA